MDQTARNQRKATILDHLGEATATLATVAVAILFNHLFTTPADDFQIAAIVAVSFIAFGFLTRMVTATFGPTINRLRGLPANKPETETVR